MSYSPGTHIIATLQSPHLQRYSDYSGFKALLANLIETHNLQQLGEVYHNFEPQGFTGVVCLSESHVSVHTWPEYGRINVDIYLSNFQRQNDGTVHAIYEAIKTYFGGTISDEEILKR